MVRFRFSNAAILPPLGPVVLYEAPSAGGWDSARGGARLSGYLDDILILDQFVGPSPRQLEHDYRSAPTSGFRAACTDSRAQAMRQVSFGFPIPFRVGLPQHSFSGGHRVRGELSQILRKDNISRSRLACKVWRRNTSGRAHVLQTRLPDGGDEDGSTWVDRARVCAERANNLRLQPDLIIESDASRSGWGAVDPWRNFAFTLAA